MKSTHTNKVVMAGFSLALPDVFNLKPAFVVPLPANREAYIYDDMQPRRDDYSQLVKGWRLVIMYKGAACKRTQYRGDNGAFYSNPLDVAMRLNEVAAELTPKVKAVKHTENYEDD